MTTVDSSNFLIEGGYLQKGKLTNVRPKDLGQKAYYLPPSRYIGGMDRVLAIYIRSDSELRSGGTGMRRSSNSKSAASSLR
jgi:hypothetical protein